MHRRRAVGRGPLGALVTLLVLGLEHDAAEAEAALGGDVLAALGALRLVEQIGTELRPLARLVPHDELLIASDLGGKGGYFTCPAYSRPPPCLPA